MKILSSIEIIKSNPERYYLTAKPTGPELVSLLVKDALFAGEIDISIKNYEGWFVISSQSDWLIRNHKGLSDWKGIFNSLIPFPEKGELQHRSEIFLMAFAESIFVFSLCKEEVIKGAKPQNIEEHITGGGFSIFFKM
ncbi:MAG TPA: hypothetical protein ENH91_00265 [Leeuwenhoekiella sp.]|nr:hypothetical protein [Leeuwenhoekiella sp.]